MSKHDEFAQQLSDKVISMMQNEKRAPWQRPWIGGHPPKHGFGLPYNAISGKGYRGANTINLLVQGMLNGYTDDRWVTYKQAQELGAQVKKGEKSTLIQFWKAPEKADATKPNSVDKEKWAGPTVMYACVFNADQIDGMPLKVDRVMPDPKWRHDECERLMKECGVSIFHDGGDQAFYIPSRDEIHLPEKQHFLSADGYYATVIHEIGHSTGHHSRLDRDMKGKRGTESYAKEEMVAELSSMMVGERLGIGYDPGQHVAYVEHWIKILKDDPKEIMRAASSAEKVCQYLKIEGYQREVTKIINQEKALEIAKQVHEPEIKQSIRMSM